MRPLFQPSLVNDAFGDPGLYVDCLFEKRALLFDLGDIGRLAPRKILRVSHVFVSHTHMDHFIGFDRLLRICLGRERSMHLFGPAHFLEQVEHKLAAYTWNLVQNYATDFTLHVTEVHADGQARRATFRCQGAFRREGETAFGIADGLLLDEAMFSVRARLLDHKTPCLAFALQEKSHVNIWKNRLAEKGLSTGPWLRELKQAVLRGAPDATLVPVGRGDNVRVPLGELKADILRIVPGQKIAYVTDVVYDERNAARIVQLARDADLLFIESTFLQQDAARAAEKYHLTAHQAGLLARAAGARSVVPFHFSPTYTGQEELVRSELERAYAAGAPG